MKGRTTWFNPNARFDEEELEEEEDEDEDREEPEDVEPEDGPPLLTPLSEDQGNQVQYDQAIFLFQLFLFENHVKTICK